MKRPKQIHILIADDHPVVREGLGAIISRQKDMKVIAEARNWPEVVEQVLRHRPQVALMDLHMPGQPAAAISAILDQFPAARIVIFSAFAADEEVYRSFQAGACGYVLKGESSRENLLACIRTVADGRVWVDPMAAVRLTDHMKTPDLTEREREIMQLVVTGKSNKEIGSCLNVTEGTVKVHMNHIFAKLGVDGRVAAVKVATQRGIASLSGNGPLVAPDAERKKKGSAA
jgi:two-component system, NarL family, response regulator